MSQPFPLSRTRRSPACSGDGGILVNTDRAHRLVYRAWKKGGQSLQQTVISNLFQALIIDRKDVSNVKILSEIADASCLMSKDEVGPTSFASIQVAPDPLTTDLGHHIPHLGPGRPRSRRSNRGSSQGWHQRSTSRHHRGQVGHQWWTDPGRVPAGEPSRTSYH